MSDIRDYEILDVTLRDGGYKNNFNFSNEDITTIISLLEKTGVRYIEVGYRNGPLTTISNIGITGLSTNQYIKYIRSLVSNCNIVVILHPKNVSFKDIQELKESGTDLIRICLPKTIDEHTIEIIKEIKNNNLNFTFNVTRVTEYKLDTLKKYLDQVLNLGPNILYFADSNGGLTPEKTKNLFSNFIEYNIPLGFHAHNNLYLAMANTIAAMNSGVKFIDTSIAGLGKGAGNLKLEAFISYLNLLDLNCEYELSYALQAKTYVEAAPYFNNDSQIKDMIMGFFNLSQNYIDKLDSNLEVQALFNQAKSLVKL